MLRIVLTVLAILFSIGSASAWFYASRVKVPLRKAMAMAHKRAAKTGVKSNGGFMSFDDWDFRETVAAQARWNSIGAISAGMAILLQAVVQWLPPEC